MRSLLAFAVAMLVSACAGNYPSSTENLCNVGTGVCLAATSLTGGVSSGWIDVARFDRVTFDLVVVDGNNSITTLDADCETSRSASTTAGAGSEICSRSTASGVSTMTCPHLWQWTGAELGAAEAVQFQVMDLDARYLQCNFTGSAGVITASIDTIAISAAGSR